MDYVNSAEADIFCWKVVGRITLFPLWNEACCQLVIYKCFPTDTYYLGLYISIQFIPVTTLAFEQVSTSRIITKHRLWRYIIFYLLASEHKRFQKQLQPIII